MSVGSIAEQPAPAVAVTPLSIDRFRRQADLIPGEKISRINCTVVGVGAVGRQLALMLAAIGAKRLTLVDFDLVDISNMTTQGYGLNDVTRPKVDVVSDEIRHRYSDVATIPIYDEFRTKYNGSQAVFCCVDSIRARTSIWDSVCSDMQFWGDTRMLGETIRILTASALDAPSYGVYRSSLFDETQAEPGRCTAASTVYTAALAAGLMVHQFSRWLRGQQTDRDLLLSLPASMMEAFPDGMG